MANENEIQIILKLINNTQASLSQARSQFEEFSKKTESTLTSAADKTSQRFQKLFSKDITDAIQKTVGAIASVGLSVGGLASIGAEVDNLERAFKNLSQSAGLSAGTLKTSLQEGFQGSVSNAEIFRITNRALIAELPITTENARLLAEAANRIGDSVGVDAANAFETLTVAITRQSEKALKSLGVSVDTSSAYEKLAESLGKTTEELTDQEKAGTFLNLTLESLKTKLSLLGPDTDNFSNKLNRLKSDLSNLKDEIALSVADGVNELFKLTNFDFSKLSEGVRAFREQGFSSNKDLVFESRDSQLSADKERLQEIKNLLSQGFKEGNGVDFFDKIPLTQKEINDLKKEEIGLQIIIEKQQESIASKIKEAAGNQHQMNVVRENFNTLLKSSTFGLGQTSDEMKKLLQQESDHESEKSKIIDSKTSITSTSGIKNKPETIDDLIRKSQNPLSPGGISEAFKTQFLGSLPGQDLRRSSFLESGGVLPGESLSRSAREDRARSLGNSLNFDFKSLSPKQETQGSAPAQGQGENQKREESLNRLKQKTSDSLQKEIKLLTDISKQFENSIRNSDRLIGVVENQAGVLKEHESRITNLERIASSK